MGPAALPPRPVQRQCARDGGFTLLEILVVVTIIAIIVSVALLSMGTLGADHGLDEEIQRFTDVIEVAHEQAELEGRDYGIVFLPDQFEVRHYDQRSRVWMTPIDDRLLARHSLPDGVSLTLQVDGRPVILKRPDPGKEPLPQVLVMSSGDITPYVLTLQRDGSRYLVTLTGQPDGTIKVEKPDDE
jgi:general secretion pathway protein H